MMTERCSFPKAKRLLANRQFSVVMSRRLAARDGLLVMYALENGLGYSRLGISIGKSCGKAVVRNRLKRLLREVFRQNQQRIPAGYDYVVSMSMRWAGRVGDSSRRKQEQVQAASRNAEPESDKSLAKAAVRGLTFEQVRDSFLALAAKLAAKGF